MGNLKAGGDGMKLGFIQKYLFLATKDIYNISNDGKCGQDKCLKFWQLSLGVQFLNLNWVPKILETNSEDLGAEAETL